MPKLPLILILDDDESMLLPWQLASKGVATIIFVASVDLLLAQLKIQSPQLIVLDRFLGPIDLLAIDLVKKIRQTAYPGPVVLSSDLRISEAELNRHGLAGQIEKRKVTARYLPGFMMQHA